jgi:short-subunit dehydrogenase
VELQGSTVLLTGATGGIGHAIARRLRAEGASLILTGRRAEVLEPLAAEVGGRALAVDLSDRDAVRSLAAQCGDVDVVISNAGLPASGPVGTFTEEELDRALDVNLRAPIVLARLLLDGMLARGKGHLVFVSSLAGRTSAPGSAVYSATKFGLRGFVQGLRADLKSTPVSASTIFPGFISDAGMYADAAVPLPPGVGTSTPEEVAAAVVRAITADKGEVTVAPVTMRVGTNIAELAPGPAAAFNRLMGAERIGGEFADAQREKR